MTGPRIHPSTTMGAEVEVASDAEVGPNCYLDGRISIGSRTKLISSVSLTGAARLGEACVIEPNVTMTNASAAATDPDAILILGDGVHVGAGSVLARGVIIGVAARISAGTIVTRNVPAYAIVSGNPAAITGYVSPTTPDAPLSIKRIDDAMEPGRYPCNVAGVSIFKYKRIRDLRGDLSVGEFGRNVPFEAKRFFLVYDVPSAETRGEHAHRVCEQFLICVSGYVAVVVDDGLQREEVELNAPNIGLYIPPKVWGVQYKYSPNAVLLVFASHYYDESDYIRDYDDFIHLCGRRS